MDSLRAYIRELVVEENVLAIGMCFPFAIQKAEEWFKQHYTPPDDPEQSGVKHPDLDNMDKFKVVHGTVTSKWENPPKPVVHAWVEMGDLVLDDQTSHGERPGGVPKNVYYDMYQPEATAEFTAEEALTKCTMSGYEGPWDEESLGSMRQRDAWLGEGLLRATIRELISEGIEFREVDSPLEYGRSGNVKRIALCDSSVTEPPGKHDSYFAEIEKWRKYTKGGRKLKKPKLDEIIPGVSDVCIIGFLDYHQKAKLESGVTFWYIDYMKTRSDMRGQGSASQLVEKFYEMIPQSGDYVNFGKMMQPQVGHLKDKMAEEYPEIKTKGAEYF